MADFFQTSAFLAVFITFATFELGRWLKKKWNKPFVNPLLIGVVLTIVLLLILDMDYTAYSNGIACISFFLTPATICLAVPLYEKFELLKKNYKAVLLGIGSGVLSSLVCILALSALFRLDHATYVTLMPKSITTAIGMGVSEELGGYPSLTVAAIVITGILGNIFAEIACRLFRITEPVARGVAIGTSTHAIGTSKALELGEIEGAMSGLSLTLAGILTVVLAGFFAPLL